jgi:DNA-binding Lrp family transcriptional regulator
MLEACVLLKTVPTKAYAILGALKEMKGVKKAYLVYGRFDLVAFLQVEDYPALKKATTEVNSWDGVRSTETLAEA